MNNLINQLLPEIILISIFLLPVLLACTFLMRRLQPVSRALLPWAAFPAVLSAVLIQPGFSVNINWLLLNTRFGINTTAQVFLFFTSVIWLAAGIYAVHYLKQGRHAVRFFISYLLAMSGNLGLIIAQDVISFYCFFALMSFSSYGLVVHSGTDAARKAGKVYISLVVLGEIMIFTALALAVHAGGSMYLNDLPEKIAVASQRHLIIGLVLLGFGIKAGALPLHVWLPLAHPVAPTPASAVLSACMIKAGLLGWLNFLPLGEAALQGWGAGVIVFGFLAAFGGVIAGLMQDQPKTVLAYSSISQMGLITVMVGCALILPVIWPLCWAAIMIYATHHAFAKGALFLSVSAVGGRGASVWRKTIIIVSLLFPTFAIAGAPFTSGIVAKNSLKYIFKKTAYELQLSDGILFILTLSAAATTLLLARFLWTLWKLSARDDSHAPVTPGMIVPWVALGVFCMVIPFQSFYLNLVPGGRTDNLIDLFYDISAVLPLILGILIALFVIKSGFCVPLRIPAGDILTLYNWSLKMGWLYFRNCAQKIMNISNNFRQSLLNILNSRSAALFLLWKKLDTGDTHLGEWKLFGAGFLFLAITFFVLLA